MDATLDISVVVPLYNEEESLPELVEWIDRVARGEGLSYEVILVDDGSGDGSWRVIENLHERFAAVRGIKFARNYGKSAALYCGFAEARGEVVFTMDADLQDSPDEIPALRRMVLDEGYDLVSGWKKKRHDPAGKRWPSKFFNWTARTVSSKLSKAPRAVRYISGKATTMEAKMALYQFMTSFTPKCSRKKMPSGRLAPKRSSRK